MVAKWSSRPKFTLLFAIRVFFFCLPPVLASAGTCSTIGFTSCWRLVVWQWGLWISLSYSSLLWSCSLPCASHHAGVCARSRRLRCTVAGGVVASVYRLDQRYVAWFLQAGEHESCLDRLCIVCHNKHSSYRYGDERLYLRTAGLFSILCPCRLRPLKGL